MSIDPVKMTVIFPKKGKTVLTALVQDKVKSIYNKSSSYYDYYHSLGTFRFDEKGRKYLVDKVLKPSGYVPDAGGENGLTSLRTAKI